MQNGRRNRPGAVRLRRHVFITLNGFAAFFGGAILIVIALIVAIVQIVAVMQRRELIRFLPPALGATAVGLLCGLYLALGAEYQWVSPSLLDDLTLPVMIAALGWMFYNRMGSKRNRGEGRSPHPDRSPPP